jgi:hypothetical protein
MPGQNSGEMVMIGAVIAVAALVAFIFVVTIQSRRAADPSNTSVVDIDDLASLVALDATGAFVLNIYRQSGNPHADGQVYETRQAALGAALSTFRRAKIETVSIRINTRDKLDVSRALFDHRGRAEGKKVGGFEIIRVAG